MIMKTDLDINTFIENHFITQEHKIFESLKFMFILTM